MEKWLSALGVIGLIIGLFVKSKGKKVIDAQKEVGDAISRLDKNPKDTSAAEHIIND